MSPLLQTMASASARGYSSNALPPVAGTIAFSTISSPFVNAYAWFLGFGTKYANPATIPTDNGYGASFKPAGDAVGFAHNNTPYVTAYPWSSGFGTKYSDPATLPTGLGTGISFLNGAVAVSHLNSPRVTAYP